MKPFVLSVGNPPKHISRSNGINISHDYYTCYFVIVATTE